MVSKYNETWDLVERLHPLADEPQSEHERNIQTRTWQWLEKLQGSGHLRELDIMQLAYFVEAAYDYGVEVGRRE